MVGLRIIMTNGHEPPPPRRVLVRWACQRCCQRPNINWLLYPVVMRPVRVTVIGLMVITNYVTEIMSITRYYGAIPRALKMFYIKRSR